MSDRTSNPNYTPEQAQAVIRLELALLIGQIARRPDGLQQLIAVRDQLQRFANCKANRRSRSRPP